MAKDPYRVLGVAPGAPEDEIKAAYRRLAKECHPDLHPGDPNAAKRMNELNEAYDAVRNPSHTQSNPYSRSGTGRSAYGQGGYGGNPYGDANRNSGTGNSYGRGGYYGWGSAGQEDGEDPFEEIFRRAYEQQRDRRQGGPTGRVSLGKVILIAALIYLFFSVMSRFFGPDPALLNAYYDQQPGGAYSYQQPEEEGAAENGAEFWNESGSIGNDRPMPYGGTGSGSDPNPFGQAY